MTLRERIRHMIMAANGQHVVLGREIADHVMPSVLMALDDKSKKLGHGVFDYEKPADGYPEVLYTTLWIYVKPIIFEYLETHHPEHEHKSLYMTSN